MRTEDADQKSSGADGSLGDRPPFFRTWPGVYAAVLGFHAFLIFLFYLFTRYFR